MIKPDQWGFPGTNNLPEVVELTAPTPGAVLFSLDEVKTHLRLEVDETDEDTLLGLIRSAATRYVETICNMSFLPRSVTVSFSRWPCRNEDFKFPIRPIRSILAVRYNDPSGNTVVMPPADYRFRALKTGGMLAPLYDQAWPDHLDDRYPVDVDMEVGFLPDNPLAPPAEWTFSAVPDELKYAILLTVGDMYENRESQAVSTRIYSSMFDNKTFRRLVAEHRLSRTW